MTDSTHLQHLSADKALVIILLKKCRNVILQPYADECKE